MSGTTPRPARWQTGVVVVALWAGSVGWFNWVKLGESRRNSYEMFRSLQRLGLDELTPLRVVWFLVPVLCLAAALLAVFGRRGFALGVLVPASLVVGGAGLGVIREGLSGGPGPALAVGSAGAALALIFVKQQPAS